MQRSQQTKARFTRLCQIGAVLLAVPILMAIGCPLTVTVTCPSAGEAGTSTTVTVSVDFGQGAATWTTDATNGTVADGTTDSPSVTPTAAGTVTVTATATDEAGDTATDECTFEATAEPCTDDTDCDDGLFCNGVETCDTDAGSCVAGTDQCTGDGESCDEATDSCIVACDTDADCDDGDACTTDTCTNNVCSFAAVDCDDLDACTDDSCDVATGCVNTDVVCDAGEECSGGDCVLTCTAAVDCDDSDPCTDEACVSGLCENTAKDCDDGDLCTTDSCDGGTGDCVNDAVVCDAGEACDDATGVCEEIDDCIADVDCDDGLFCNGTETCDLTDPLAGVCAAGTDPCGGAACDETSDDCDSVMFTLTLEQDIGAAFTGAGGNDTYSAPLVFNPPTGTNLPSLQTGDILDGAGGADTLTATIAGAAVLTTAPTIANIEVFNVTDFATAAQTIAGGNITGMTDFNISNSTNGTALIINNLPALSNLGVATQAIGVTMVLQTAATSSTTDAQTLTLSGMTAGTVTITSGTTNGVETLNIKSEGSENTVADIVMNGTTLATVNVSGDQKLTLTASLDAGVTTVNGSGSSAGSVLTQTNAGAFTYTGGTGDDTIILGGTYGSTDTLNGGEGTDILGGTTAVIGGTTAAQSGVTNFDTLRISNAHTTALDAHDFGSITEVVLDLGSNAGTITDVNSGVKVTCGSRAGTAAGAGALGVTLLGSGTSDSATYTLNDCEQAGAVTFTGAETLNIVSNLDLDGSAANTGTAGANVLATTLILTPTASLEKVVITGTESLNLTGAVTAEEIDASGFAQPLVMGAATTTVGVTVKGGDGADTLFASSGDDIVVGGAGIDILNSLAGNDIVTGGAGADIFRQSAAALLGIDRQTITDFDDTITTGDVFNLNTGVETLDGTDNFATSASIQTHSASGNLTVNAAAEVVVVTVATVTNFTVAASLSGTNLITAIGGTITVPVSGGEWLFAVADASGNVGIYFGDAGANTALIAAELTLVAVLQGSDVSISGLIFNNFTNGA